MPEVAYPAVARTTHVTLGLHRPQEILQSQYAATRQVLYVGDPRWIGSVQITADKDVEHSAETLTQWLAAMADGGAWCYLPLGVYHDDGPWSVAAYDPATGVARLTGATPDMLSGAYLSDGKRVRGVLSTTAVAGGANALLSPLSPPLSIGASVRTVTTIPAYYRPGDNAAIGAALTKTPDWAEPVEVPFVERVTP